METRGNDWLISDEANPFRRTLSVDDPLALDPVTLSGLVAALSELLREQQEMLGTGAGTSALAQEMPHDPPLDPINSCQPENITEAQRISTLETAPEVKVKETATEGDTITTKEAIIGWCLLNPGPIIIVVIAVAMAIVGAAR